MVVCTILYPRYHFNVALGKRDRWVGWLSWRYLAFIIRGVSLLGVASAGTARGIRDDIWRHLADDWKPRRLEAICRQETTLKGLPEVFKDMLLGQSFGRTVVKTG